MKENLKTKWPLLVAALIMLAVTWLNKDPEALSNLSAEAILPIVILTVVIFLLKTGVLSLALLGLRKLWHWIFKKER